MALQDPFPSPRRRRRSPAMLAAAFALSLGGCQTAIDVRGFVPDDESLSRIEVGKQNKDDVRELLGTPSTVGLFGDETWLYISRRTSTYAFLEPKILEQKVVAILFDEQGSVTDIRKLELSDGKVVEHVARVTPSPGKELSFLEQLLGNVGRFNKANRGAYIPGTGQAPPPGTGGSRR